MNIKSNKTYLQKTVFYTLLFIPFSLNCHLQHWDADHLENSSFLKCRGRSKEPILLLIFIIFVSLFGWVKALISQVFPSQVNQAEGKTDQLSISIRALLLVR